MNHHISGVYNSVYNDSLDSLIDQCQNMLLRIVLFCLCCTCFYTHVYNCKIASINTLNEARCL